MSGRVLVVTYYFPPIGGVGIQRTLKYVTYLPRAGWQPVVVTAENPGVTPRDEDALRLVPPGLVVERAFSPEPVKLRRAVGRLAKRAIALRGRTGAGTGGGGSAGAAEPSRSTDAPSAQDAGAAGGSSGGRIVSTLRKVASTWDKAVMTAFFPDEQVTWVPFAVRRALAVLDREPIDVVYSTAAPISSHLAAALVAARRGCPWVADFRDPWIGNAYAPDLEGLHGRLQRAIERRIVTRADRVVFASQGFADAYAARYPELADRFVAISNGYDRNGLPAPAPREADGRFHLVYAGSIYGDQLNLFLEGLDLLVARRPEVRDRLLVEFIGWLTRHNEDVAARYSTPDRLGSMLRFTGFLPHREALARMQSADALLQIVQDGPGKGQIQSGKLAEYVGLDRQILAVVPEGEARKMLRELDWGVIADPTPEGVADGVERLLAMPAPTRRADPEGRYDRVNLAKQLGAILDEVVAERARRAVGGRKP